MVLSDTLNNTLNNTLSNALKLAARISTGVKETSYMDTVRFAKRFILAPEYPWRRKKKKKTKAKWAFSF